MRGVDLCLQWAENRYQIEEGPFLIHTYIHAHVHMHTHTHIVLSAHFEGKIIGCLFFYRLFHEQHNSVYNPSILKVKDIIAGWFHGQMKLKNCYKHLIWDEAEGSRFQRKYHCSFSPTCSVSSSLNFISVLPWFPYLWYKVGHTSRTHTFQWILGFFPPLPQAGILACIAERGKLAVPL